MSNKRQVKISHSQGRQQQLEQGHSNYITRRYGSKQCCDLSIVRPFLWVLLLTTSILCATSAKLEAKAKTETETVAVTEQTLQLNTPLDEEIEINWRKSPERIKEKFKIDDDNERMNENENEHEHHRENHLEYEHHFYRSELQRVPYETINRILRDEHEPIFRREDADMRYYHTRSLQPTHEVVRRSAELTITSTPSTPTTTTTPITPTPTTATFNHNLNLRAKNLTDFDRVRSSIITQNAEAITAIDLSSNHFESIDLRGFTNVLTANLSHNALNEFPSMRNSTLELLNLNGNRIQKAQIPQNDHLRTLYLSGNNIENLTALNFTMLNALETLDLSCNRIENLETTFFPRLMHNLKYLNLAHNRLGSISRETFYNLLSLNTLLLAHNSITYIDYETFLSLPNLQYLDLSHNQLKGESIRALQGIPDLVGLSIAYNPEMGESLQEFVASWSLKEVDASGTGLCQIPAALAQAVRTLKLADNWLKIINCGDLDSYPLLQYLDLSNSHIEDIEDDAMGRLEFLEILFLDHNQLRKVPVSLPTSLEHLFLHHNEIMDLQVQAFQGLRNLKTLDLSHNKLLYVPALPLPKLLTLNLQASGLQGLNQAIVHSLPHLRDLLLEENPIKCSDLLGIAEWASPCRIAERNTNKPIDGEQQIGNLDVGQQQQQQQQQQMQTVAKIDLKQNFVQTHNFYEKFNIKGGSCSDCCADDGIGIGVGGSYHGVVGKQMFATGQTPPNCAIELDDNVESVEKPIVLAVHSENIANEQQKLLPHDTTTTATIHTTTMDDQTNVHSNVDGKVYEHNFRMSQTTNTGATARIATNSPRDAIENSTFMPATTEPAIQINVNRATISSTPMITKIFKTKSPVITEEEEDATTTTKEKRISANNVATDMPARTFPTINSKQNSMPTTSIKLIQPTTTATTTTTTTTTTTASISSTSTLNNSGKVTKIPAKIATTTTTAGTKSIENLLPQTMPTKIPTTTSSNYAMQYSTSSSSSSSSISSTRASLLERQRRVEVEQATTMTTTETPIMDKTLPTTLMSDMPDKSLAQNIANADADADAAAVSDDKKNKRQQKPLKISKNPRNSEKSKTTATKTTTTTKNDTSDANKITPTIATASSPESTTFPTTTTTATTTTLPTPHKHVTLQLHVKDRHLIGTPLLTHHGENFLVAADELQSNPNHQATNFDETTTTTMATTSKMHAAEIQVSLKKTNSIESQSKPLKNHSDYSTKNDDDDVQISMGEKSFVAKSTTQATQIKTTKTTTAMHTPSKVTKKLHHEPTKKKPSLIMKKMTITTKHASSTNSPNIPTKEFGKQQQQQQQLQNVHHHYTLNTPRENEVTMAQTKFPTEAFLNSNFPHANYGTSYKQQHQQQEQQKPQQYQFHHSNAKHSTVNTPIINGHQHELQTFQEHNELEEMAAAAAAASAAHASTSAIIGKINKLGSTTTTSTSAKWYDLRKTTAIDAAHPGIVILLSFGLFVVLLIGLLRVYRCDIPWPLRHRQRHHQRPHRMHQQHQHQNQQQQQHHQQHQQTNFNDDDGHSFLSFQSSSSNQFSQRKWRLETTQKQTKKNQHPHQHQQSTTISQHRHRQEEDEPKQHQSPFHNLQVRELQQTSAVEAGPKYARETYKLTNALGERSTSQSSSSCSPPSSSVFDDETFYIEMTTEMGQAGNIDANTLAHGDLLPMELLNVSKGAIRKNVEHAEVTSQSLNSNAFQTSSLDDDDDDATVGVAVAAATATSTLQQQSSKLTPTTRKLGIW